MQRRAGSLQLFSARREMDGVVAVASIGRAATRAHEPAVAELAQVVRHETLLLADERRQLANRAVAVRELAQQPPPQRMRDELHESRWIAASVVRLGRRGHTTKLFAPPYYIKWV